MTLLFDNAYGKSAIRLVHVRRDADRHDLHDLTVAIQFSGSYHAAYHAGDNTSVLPTDTMKNTVYCLAKELGVGEPEEFALALGRHFLDGNPETERVRVEVIEQPWSRVSIDNRPHPHAFTPAPDGKRSAVATCGRDSTAVESGLRDLVLLKTTGSAFAGFRADRFTSLAATSDRILATSVEATWRYDRPTPDWGSCWRTVRRRLVESFADHESLSVQHTIWVLGEAALEALPEITEIHLRMPNRHHLPVDLGPFGLDGRGEVFVATDAPYGLIEGTLRRS